MLKHKANAHIETILEIEKLTGETLMISKEEAKAAGHVSGDMRYINYDYSMFDDGPIELKKWIAYKDAYDYNLNIAMHICRGDLEVDYDDDTTMTLRSG